MRLVKLVPVTAGRFITAPASPAQGELRPLAAKDGVGYRTSAVKVGGGYRASVVKVSGGYRLRA